MVGAAHKTLRGKGRGGAAVVAVHSAHQPTLLTSVPGYGMAHSWNSSYRPRESAFSDDCTQDERHTHTSGARSPTLTRPFSARVPQNERPKKQDGGERNLLLALLHQVADGPHAKPPQQLQVLGPLP